MRWSNEEIAILKENYSKKPEEIQKLIPNRPWSAIRQKALDLKLTRPSLWTPQEIQFLKDWGFPEDWRSSTQELLQNMYEVWQPKLWIHGHMHKAAKNQLGKTLFISLDELGYVDVNEDLEVEN